MGLTPFFFASFSTNALTPCGERASVLVARITPRESDWLPLTSITFGGRYEVRAMRWKRRARQNIKYFICTVLWIIH